MLSLLGHGKGLKQHSRWNGKPLKNGKPGNNMISLTLKDYFSCCTWKRLKIKYGSSKAM